MFITDPFITEPFVTDHVDNGPLLNVYCSVDAKSPNHFAQHPSPRPALGTNNLLLMWSVMNGSAMNWSAMNWSVMNVVCYERSLL